MCVVEINFNRDYIMFFFEIEKPNESVMCHNREFQIIRP